MCGGNFSLFPLQMTPDYHFQTRSIHTPLHRKDQHGALGDPIYMTATYVFDAIEDAAAVMSEESDSYIYGRHQNPTQGTLELKLADLEGAEAAATTASGIAAISTTLLSLLAAGDEIVIHHTLYTNAMLFFDNALPRLGIKVTKVDLSDAALLRNALNDRTRLVYFESVINPTCEVLDIAAISKIAHDGGALVMVDSTFVSPALQRPLQHGADIVIHSLTKYINGHGDLLGGVILGKTDLIDRIRDFGLKCITGATLSPHSCFLVLRGVKTLSLRMRQHSTSALAIARVLESHVAVKTVKYPFLESNPQRGIAEAQMLQGGGMLSFELHAGFDGASKLIANLRLIKCAVSLGDAVSLITHPAALFCGRQRISPEARMSPGISTGLIRLSIGLEDVEDLIADLTDGLASI